MLAIEKYDGKGRHYPTCKVCNKKIELEDKVIIKTNPKRYYHIKCYVKMKKEVLKQHLEFIKLHEKNL